MLKFKYIILLFFAFSFGIHSFAQNSFEVVLPALNEVIELGLNNNFDIKINHQLVEISKGESQSYKGAFDPIFGADVSTMSGISSDATFKNPSTADFYLYLPTKIGLNITTGVNYFRQYDLSDNGQSEIGNGTWLQVDIPILKGLGLNNKNLINYETSKLKLKTQEVTFDFEITQYIKNVVLAYASVYCYSQIYNSQKLIIDNFAQYKKDIEQKIDKEIIPASEIINVNAEMVQLNSELNTDFDKLRTSYVDLLKLLGQEKTIQDVKKISIPFSPPKISVDTIKVFVSRIMANIDEIAKNSLLYQKQELVEERLKMEVKAAKNETRHDLNLQLKYNYNSEELNGNWNNLLIFPKSTFPGSNYKATLNYQLPINNNRAKGMYIAKNEEYNLEKESTGKFLFEIKKDIENVSSSLLSSLEVFNMQKDISELRAKAYSNELLKYRTGNSTQLDVLNAHRSFTGSLLAVHSMEYTVINYLVTLKFLCNQIPKNSTELNSFHVFSTY
jgi:outer membrane protein TolC